MDQMMVDVTAIPDVQVGDKVVLVGTDGAETITMEQIAAAADTFNYEFVYLFLHSTQGEGTGDGLQPKSANCCNCRGT